MVQDEYNNDGGQCFNLRLSYNEVQKMDTLQYDIIAVCDGYEINILFIWSVINQ